MIKKNALVTVTTSTIAPMNRLVKKLTETFSGASLNEYRLVATPMSEMTATSKVDSKSICRANSPKGGIAKRNCVGVARSIMASATAMTPLTDASRPKKAATPREVRPETRSEASAPSPYNVAESNRNWMAFISSLLSRGRFPSSARGAVREPPSGRPSNGSPYVGRPPRRRDRSRGSNTGRI